MAEIGDRIGLSASAVTRRVDSLEGDQIILGYTAVLDHKAIGLKVNAFVTVTLVRQSQEVIDAFEQAVVTFPEGVEGHLMAGSTDYLLRVTVPHLEAYEGFLKQRLTRLRGIAHVHSSVSSSRLYALRTVSLAHLSPDINQDV